MTARIEFGTARQWLRLAAGLLVTFGLAAMFAYAALVTADSLAKQIGAWVVCGLFVVFGAAVLWGGLRATEQAFVVSSEGIARDASRQPWRISWYELRAVAVEKSYSVVGRYRPALVFRRSKTWRVVVRLAPKDPDDFAARHPELKVYRGRFGAWTDEWGIWLGPPRELIAPLDEALRAYGGDIYQGHFDNGEQPSYSLFVHTVDVHPHGRPLP